MSHDGHSRSGHPILNTDSCSTRSGLVARTFAGINTYVSHFASPNCSSTAHDTFFSACSMASTSAAATGFIGSVGIAALSPSCRRACPGRLRPIEGKEWADCNRLRNRLDDSDHLNGTGTGRPTWGDRAASLGQLRGPPVTPLDRHSLERGKHGQRHRSCLL